MIEQDTRFIIDNNLINKNWILDIKNPQKNVFFESDILRIIDNPKLRKLKKRPDYVLIDSNKKPIAIIEAKAGGTDLAKAIIQARDYAEILEAPLIFAMNNSYCQTNHLHTNKPLYINENEVNELIRQKEALKFLQENTNSIYTIPKEVIVSRQGLISVFKNLNNTLRGEGLRAGIERLSEFANILFLKLYTENKADNVWASIKRVDNEILISTVNQTLKHIEQKYGASVFTELHIKKPETLREIINKLDKLTLSTIDTDIKGDAFEYFLQQATATSNDLGEYFTPRHITKTIVNLVNPKFKETVYDPFCGTGGFLTEAFNHIKDNTIINTEDEKEILKEKTIFGSEITTNSRLAKMNMILHGDGHSGVKQLDSLENPIDGKYDIVITNMPFSQKTKFSHLYYNSLSNGLNNADGTCLLHCFKAVKKGGRIAVIVPEGFLAKSHKVIKFLLNNSQLQTVISLPKSLFLPYAGVETSILYFRDCHLKKTENSIWFFDVKQDGLSSDRKREKIKENDLKKIDYVNFEKKKTVNDISEIGFYEVNYSDIQSNKYSLIGRSYRNQINKHLYKVGDILLRNKSVIEVKDTELYKRVKIKLYGKGCHLRDIKKGIDIGTKKQFVIKEGQFILSKIDARNGAFGFVNKSLDNAIITGNFWAFDVNVDLAIPEFLHYFFSSEEFMLFCKNKSIGTTNRQYLNEAAFLKASIPLPSKEEQGKLISKIKDTKDNLKKFEDKLENHKKDINKVWTKEEKENLPDEFFNLLEKSVKPLE